MIAIGTVLAQIKLYRMPNGGSVTLVSMLPFLLVSYRHGTEWGLITGLANSMLQMVLGGIYMPPAGTVLAMTGGIVFDYILAYLVLGLGSLFSKAFRNDRSLAAIITGSAISMFLRFICAFVSGFLIWGSITLDGAAAVIYSLSYNASYLVPEIILTIMAEAALFRIYPQAFR